MEKPAEIVTANRLRDGAVVYWNDGRFVEALAGAEVLADAVAVKAALTAAAEAVAQRLVVGVYAFKARVEAGAVIPLEEREIIRARGPSVTPQFGKQADPSLSPQWSASAQPPSPRTGKGPEAFDVSL